MRNQPALETSRLLLRPFQLSDAADVQRLAGDRSIADTTSHVPHPYRDGMAEAWISAHLPDFIDGKAARFAITSKADGYLIGSISLMSIAFEHQAELGYWIGRPYWSNGYCSEAGLSILDFAFNYLALARVHSHHFTRNPASGRVMRKLGMKHEGSRPHDVKKWGILEGRELYGILREDWFSYRSEMTSL